MTEVSPNIQSSQWRKESECFNSYQLLNTTRLQLQTLIASRVTFLCDFLVADELRSEQERNKMLQEDMEATLQDIQNM